MKFLAIAILFSVSTFALADNHEKPFDQVKQQRLSNIDKRLGYLNELKSCVSSSTDKESMKNCDATHKEKMKALKEENKGWKESMKEEWKKRREKKK